jgi:hypothetical protein
MYVVFSVGDDDIMIAWKSADSQYNAFGLMLKAYSLYNVLFV